MDKTKTPETVRKFIDNKIKETNLNYAGVSKMLGRGPAFIQQYIKDGRPIRLKEVDRKNLARILNIEEQELTDLPLNISNNFNNDIAVNFIIELYEKIEYWVEQNDLDYTKSEKKKLIKLLYSKFSSTPTEKREAEIINFLDYYEIIRKAQ